MTDLTATLAERDARYGKFEDHAAIAQGLKDQMWATEGWSRLAPDQRQALEVIQDKVARILTAIPTTPTTGTISRAIRASSRTG